MRVFDCFMFHNELEAVEIRFEELSEVVDTFVVVEAAVSHAGVPKPMHFAENLDRFDRFRDRIRHVPLDSLPAFGNRWIAEMTQRNAIRNAVLTDAAEDDLVIISDADEIVRADVVRDLEGLESGEIVELYLDMYFYFLNLRSRQPWRSARATTASALRHLTPSEIRMTFTTESRQRAGWHFTYLTDLESAPARLRSKIASFAHREAGGGMPSDDELRRLLTEAPRFDDEFLEPVAVTAASHPRCVVEDRSRWAPYLFKGGDVEAVDVRRFRARKAAADGRRMARRVGGYPARLAGR